MILSEWMKTFPRKQASDSKTSQGNGSNNAGETHATILKLAAELAELKKSLTKQGESGDPAELAGGHE